jgi:hypothetical protein
MTLKQRLFTNLFLRNMLADFGSRSAYSLSEKNFIPYFEYKIGPYQPDQILYFSKQPLAVQYKNEIFNKLREYTGYDIVQYLEFHYEKYSDNSEFLRFLSYEVSQRINLKLSATNKLKLGTVNEWIIEKQTEYRALQQQQLKNNIEQDVRSVLEHNPASSKIDTEDSVNILSDKLSNRMESLMSDTEQRMEALTNSFITGNIELNNHNHQEKLVQLLILISTIQAPKELAKGEQVFKRFSFTDLASLLHLHFEAFKNKKLNTIQVNIKDHNETLSYKNPKVQKLIDALRDFFY